MSVKIYQQVNLYQPIFRRQRQIFSAATMLQSVAVIVVALLTIYGFGLLQVRGLEAQVVELEGRERAYSLQLARLDPTTSLGRREEIAAELARLNSTLVAQQRLIEVLREQPLGDAGGFSAQLAALARRYNPGLWLTELRINGASDAIELTGISRNADLIPAYLLRLSEESALAGKRFDLFEIERTENANEVRFRVSSQAVDP